MFETGKGATRFGFGRAGSSAMLSHPRGKEVDENSGHYRREFSDTKYQGAMGWACSVGGGQ